MDQTGVISQSQNVTTNENILALSWNIATEPKLHRKLSPNPYTFHALKTIAVRFPNSNTFDVIKAVVLAEPEGKYERQFQRLSEVQKEAAKEKQNHRTTKINKRLEIYKERYKGDFLKLPRELVYNDLSFFIFGTNNLGAVERKYTQDQRRNFRLSIVEFIENMQNNAALDDKNHDENSLSTELFDRKLVPLLPLLKIGFAVVFLLLIFNVVNEVNARMLDPRGSPNTTPYSVVNKLNTTLADLKNKKELPVRLRIPSIKVDAAIQYVGMTSQGVMGVPNNIFDVGWYDLGPRPGEKGSAVIAGHFDGEDNSAGVFTNLNKLAKGDKLYIEDSKGLSTVFIVREKRIYDPGFADIVFSQNDSPHLNLITCDGTWDGARKSYSKRLVVFADISELGSQ